MSSSSSLQSSFEDVRDDNKFNDVTLAWEDGQLVEAHKVILAGCSPQTNTPTLLSQLTEFQGILHQKIDNGTPNPQIRDFMKGGSQG